LKRTSRDTRGKVQHVMKRIGIALLITVALSAPVLAADLAARPYTKAPPVVAPAWSWTGFYLGANVGGAWTEKENFSVADPLRTIGLFPPDVPSQPGAQASGQGSGIAGGIHGGFNWQIAPQFLIGIEADISAADLKFSTRQELLDFGASTNILFTTDSKVDALSSVRGRIGFVHEDWLFYGTGGWGGAKVSWDPNLSCTGAFPTCKVPFQTPGSSSGWKSGAVYGGGVEFHIPSTNWIAGVEYLRYDLSGDNTTGSPIESDTGLPLSCPDSTPSCIHYTADRLRIDEVRARLSYKF
jgi:outer membrane immunogenic protein